MTDMKLPPAGKCLKTLSELTMVMLLATASLVGCRSRVAVDDSSEQDHAAGVPQATPPTFTGNESFEDTVSIRCWQAGPGSSARITDTNFKSGRHSLLWRWEQAQSVLTFTAPEAGAFNPKRGANFVLWVYNPKPMDGKLTFSVGTADRTDISWDFFLAFRGWRVIHFNYLSNAEELGGTPQADARIMTITAPQGIDRGEVHLDVFRSAYGGAKAAGHTSGDHQIPWVNPDVSKVNHWVRFLYHDRLQYPFEKLTADHLTQAIVDDMARISATILDHPVATTPALTPEEYDATLQAVALLEIQKTGDIITGRPVIRSENSLALENPVKVNARRPEDSVFSIMGKVSAAYHRAVEPDQKEVLREQFFLICDYLQEQGWVYGSLGQPQPHHFGYSTRNWPRLICSMRDELQKSGRWDLQVRTIQWYNNYGIIREVAPPGNADLYNTQLRSLFVLAALVSDPVEKANQFKALSRFVSKSVLSSVTDADGSMYHHNMVHPGYVYAAVDNLAWATRLLAHTEFRLDPTGHERIRKMVQAFSEVAYPATPRGLAHRCIGMGPFRTGKAALAMALAGTPDGTQAIDPSMAALYLKAMETEGKVDEYVERFRAAGIEPATLTGHFMLANAVLSAHRRSGWSVVVTGGKQDYRVNEFYGWGWTRHCLARNLNFGSIQVITEAEPQVPTDGWDHNHWPGTTAPRLPEEQLFIQYGATRNGSMLAGSTTSGQDGVWGMQLNTGRPALTGHKSVFFFGNHIVCLGSDLARGGEPLYTTILQNKIGSGDAPFAVNGTPTSEFPYTKTFEQQDLWLLGDRGIAYHIPRRNDPVTVKRSEQETLYFLPQEYKPGREAYMERLISNKAGADRSKFDLQDFNTTRGTYNLACFNHGAGPAAYAFAMEVNATADSAKAFAAAPPYTILKQDAAAHIVQHGSGQTGYAVFQDNAALNGPIRQLNRPAFVLVKAEQGRLAIHIAASEKDRAAPFHLVLQGTFEGIHGGKILSSEKEQTCIELPFRPHLVSHVILTTEE